MTTEGESTDTEPEAGPSEYGRADDGQDYIDRSSIDFDPADGLYSGTAVEGNSEIPGPHEQGDDVEGSGGTDPAAEE